MTEVLHAEIGVTKTCLGTVFISHEGLVIYCEICIYKNERLWIRMPEIWTSPQNKKRMCYWANKEISDEKQKLILGKVFDMLGLDLAKGIELRKNYFTTLQGKKKRIDKTKK